VSLSYQTFSRRVAELGDSMILQLKEVIQQCRYFSLAFDENTDTSDSIASF